MRDTAHCPEVKIESRSALAGVAGLGTDGLPLAPALVAGGPRAPAVDVDTAKIESSRRADRCIDSIPPRTIATAIATVRLEAFAHFRRFGESGTTVSAAPASLTTNREPDPCSRQQPTEQMGGVLRQGQRWVAESMTHPDNSQEMPTTALATSASSSGEDPRLASTHPSHDRQPSGRDTVNLRFQSTFAVG